jgi:hypothetical protein
MVIWPFARKAWKIFSFVGSADEIDILGYSTVKK